MPKHIGIVAVSPEGAALCYREISRRAERYPGAGGAHPTISVHNWPFGEYLAAVRREDWHAIGDLLARSGKALANIGAEFCLTPDNVMQHAIDLARPSTPIPWLTMTDLVSESITRDGRKVVGIIGTKMVMDGSIYQAMLGIKGVKLIAPEREDSELVDRVIFDELVHGWVKPESQKRVLEAIDRMAKRGAEGVILGASEIPLCVSADNCQLPIYDPVGLLADGAVKRAFAP